MPSVRILALDPGYRNLGIAIAEPGSIIHSETMLVGSPHAPMRFGNSIAQRFEDLRIEHGPFDAVAFETPPFITKNIKVSSLLWHVMGGVTTWASLQGYPIWDIMPQKLKRHCCHVTGKQWNHRYQPTKKEIAEAVALAFPTLETNARTDHEDDAALVADAYFASHRQAG